MPRRLAALLVVGAACGSSTRLPPPPPHEVVNSPEAQTPCDRDRQRAKSARERLLEDDTPEARAMAAEAVFVHAECEHEAFRVHEFAAPTSDGLADRIRLARQRYQDAVNLYEEVSQYGALRWTVGAQSRLGELHTAFSDKLREAPVPQEITDPGERATFVEELRALAATVEQRAVAAHLAAVDAATVDPALVVRDETVRARAHTSCAALSRLAPAAARDQVVCAEWRPVGDD